MLDDTVHKVSSELTLFERLKRLGVCDRSLAERGDDADGGSGGSGRSTLVADVVRLESRLNNIRNQMKNEVERCRRSLRGTFVPTHVCGVSTIKSPNLQ